LLVSPLYAASFDCNKATTETEKAICADPELSALDEFIAASYNLSRNGSSDKQKVLTEQRAWIEERDKIWLNFDEKLYYTEKDHLYHFMSKRIGSLLETVIGTNYQTVKNQFSKYTTGVAYFGEHERFMLLSAKRKKPKYQNFHNALFFDKNHKLAKVFIGDTYGRGSACEDSFSFFEDANTKTTLLDYTMSCGNGGRHGWKEIRYAATPECIQLQTLRRSNGDIGGRPSEQVGSGKLNDDLKICLEEQNYELSVDGLVFFKSDGARAFVSLDEWLVFLTDYWLYPPIKSAQAEVAGCGTASKMFTQYAVSSVRYSHLIAEYIKNKTVYDLFLPLIKTVDGDGSVKKWVAKLLTFYDSKEEQWDTSCDRVSLIQGDFHRTSPFSPSGFWKRREIDGTAEITYEILKKLEVILN
jgi:hypothetical protein